jgi:acetyl-CoA acetyltransferase
MQRCVNVIGVGMSPFSPAALGPDPSGMVSGTILEALTDAGLSADNIARVYAASGLLDGASFSRAMRCAGLAHLPLDEIAQGDVDSNLLLFRACQAISQGQAECILVLGIQSAPGTPKAGLATEHLGTIAREYMARYQSRPETFAMVAVKAYQHAAHNPLAAFNRASTLEQVLSASMIAEPLTEPQFARPSSGIAALVLCSGEFARRWHNGPLVRIVAQACVTPQQLIGLHQGTKFNDLNYEVSVAAARELYEQAGRGPQEVDVCELHDISTVSELLLYEALGFCQEGSGEKLVEDGDNTYDGNLVVNPCGGLLALGHPSMASALAQSVELVRQLRGSAGPRQVVEAQLALQHQAGDDGTVTMTLFDCE